MDVRTDYNLSQFESRIVSTWEEVYKKGQLTLWMLLSLKDGAKHMADLKKYIESATNKTLTADDQSLYRALRRFVQMELVDYDEKPSNQGGPARKVYRLTETGSRVLSTFVARNITEIYYKPKVKLILNGDKKK